MRVKSLIILSFIILSFSNSYAQKVGLVLSGGGAKGMAHIGVIKVLEENNIPIDYIAGTSMGAIIGGLYASGYSTDEMEALLTSKKFFSWSTGKIAPQYRYYYKNENPTPSWINMRIAKVNDKVKIIPFTSIISDNQMNFAFMELCSQTNVACNNNFDDLVVPYFCIATDVDKHRQVILRKGDLGNSIRSSMTFPFYFKPIRIDSVLLYDGGIVNNFPQKEMKELFKPDIIIGHNVAGKRGYLSEEDLVRQVISMIMKPTNYSIAKEDGVFLETELKDVELLDFQKGKETIKKGEETAKILIDSIKTRIHRRVSLETVNKKRKEFNSKKPQLIFNNIQVQGVDNANQRQFIIKSLKGDKKTITLEELRTEYFKLLADQHLKSIRPIAIYNEKNKNFDLNLIVETEKKVEVKIGGNISTKPISTGFGGLEYRFYDQYAYILSSNIHFGRFYNSIQLGTRIDMPKNTPFYISGYATFNRWEFFSSSSDIFFRDTQTPYIVQNEFNVRTEIGIPLSINSKLFGGINFSGAGDNYYKLRTLDKINLPEKTRFNALNVHLNLEEKSFNDRQYPTEGKYRALHVKYIFGKEKNITMIDDEVEVLKKANHSYWMIKASTERFYEMLDFLTLGVQAEALFSNRKPFVSYDATKLSAPSFSPTPHSKTIYIRNFHSDRYIAGGVKSIFHVNKLIHARLEGYAFVPVFDVHKVNNKLEISNKMFENIYFQGTAAAIYNTNLGPVSINLNYYQKESPKFYISLNFGYIIFNKRGI